MGKLTRIGTTALATTIIAAGAAAISSSNADAQIRPGTYQYTVWGDGGKALVSSGAIVRGNRIYIARERTWYDITPSPRGGSWTTATVGRKDVWRKGDGYVGISSIWLLPPSPTVNARVTLVPK